MAMPRLVALGVLLSIACEARIITPSGPVTSGPNPSPNDAPFNEAFFSGYAAARRGPTEGDVLWEKSVGTLDARGAIPMPINPRFPIASNSKLLTAVALYQLQEQGLVDLSQPVQMYLNATDMAAFGLPGQSNWCPTVKTSDDTRCRNVTFIELLEMQAGIPNQQLLPAMLPYPGSIGAAVGLFIKLPLEHEPGTAFYYSNPAFILAGYFIEKFSGMRLAAYYKTFIFDVIGMKDSYFDVFNNQFRFDARRIEEYNTFVDWQSRTVLQRGLCTEEADLGIAGAAGGVISTPQDEARFYYALFNFSSAAAMGKPLLQDPRSLLAIIKPRTPLIEGVFYAQGLYVFAANASVVFPTLLQYEGDLICPRTSNYFQVIPPASSINGYTTPLMTQAWSTGVTYFVNASTLEQAMRNQEGVFQTIISGPGFERREGNNPLADTLYKRYLTTSSP